MAKNWADHAVTQLWGHGYESVAEFALFFKQQNINQAVDKHKQEPVQLLSCSTDLL